MSIRTLLNSLERLPAERVKDGGDLEIIKAALPILPKYKKANIEIIETHQAGKSKGRDLYLNALLKKTPAETASLLANLLKQTRSMSFKPGAFKLNTEVYWPIEKFGQEETLGIREIRLCSLFYACDPNKIRIGSSPKEHKLLTETDSKVMQISAQGDYTLLLPKFIDEFKPQSAIIRLSPTDAQRWLNKTPGFFTKLMLKRALQPKKNSYFIPQPDGGLILIETKEIEIDISVSKLPACSQAIGKDLINPVIGERSFLVSLVKVFRQKSQILPTLQSIVATITNFKPRRVFNIPLLTLPEAAEILEKEIYLINSSYYEQPFLFGDNTHIVRGGIVKQLAREHFGDNILMPFDTMDAPQYLGFLETQGFNPDENPDETEEGEPHYILKEKYLLQFFRQSYARDPRDSIKWVREYYTNHPPDLKIAGHLEIDASRLVKLSLPKQMSLSGFSLVEYSRRANNELTVNQDGNKVQLRIRVPFNSPELLELQEEVCRRLGVICY